MCTCVYMYICIYVYMYMCICAYVYMCIYVYMYFFGLVVRTPGYSTYFIGPLGIRITGGLLYIFGRVVHYLIFAKFRCKCLFCEL